MDRRTFPGLAIGGSTAAVLGLSGCEPTDPFLGISGDDLASTVGDLVTIAESGRAANLAWGRISASAADLAAAPYLRDRLRTTGCADAHLEGFSLPSETWSNRTLQESP